jgi:protein ImuB
LASVDRKAASLKLYPGQTLAYARALIPHLHTVEANEAADNDGLRSIALEFLKLYSPLVALLPEPHTIWLDMTGCAHLWGGEEGLLNDLLKRLSDQGIYAKAALADTTGCAYAMARCCRKPMIVPPNQQKEWMARLPMAALRLPFPVVEGLAPLGFSRIEQLYSTPRAPLVRRFGKILMERLDQALGMAAEPLEPLSLPEMPQEKVSFTEPVFNPDFMAKAVEQLAARLCQQLEAKGLGARRLDLLFHRVDNALQAIRIGTVCASHDAQHLMRLLREKFDKVECGFGVEALTLRAPLAEPLQAVQCLNSFGEAEERDLNGLIDILHTRLGSEHVFQTTAVESDVPERSLKRISALSSHKFASWPSSLPRPARLLRQPEKVEAMALLPDHAPVQFVWRRKHYRVKRADGPERIFGEWWKDNAELRAVRDYFRVEDEAGQRFWLFRRGDGADLRTGSQEWFLHGFFG